MRMECYLRWFPVVETLVGAKGARRGIASCHLRATPVFAEPGVMRSEDRERAVGSYLSARKIQYYPSAGRSLSL